MLGQRLVDDFEARVRAVFYVGDHGQLEPIGDDPGLMRRPNLRLKQIHRQAVGSPIIRFAHGARRGLVPRSTAEAVIQDALVLADLAESQGLLAVLHDGDRHDVEQALLALHRGDVGGVSTLEKHLGIPEASAAHVVVQNGGSADLADFDVVLCGFNKTRIKVNAWIRKKRGFTGALPSVGETVICLRNDRDYQVWNGMMGVVTAIDTRRNRLSVETDDGPRRDLPFNPKQFSAEKTIIENTSGSKRRGLTLWDFGYCLTVHKSQGSEFPRVVVKEEIANTWSPERWRYTAATRASKELRWIL
jgi:ATP-dependent exoDNAse (exonuclease V) alpha subunit